MYTFKTQVSTSHGVFIDLLVSSHIDPTISAELFKYFRNTDPPRCYGSPHELPPSLQFLLETNPGTQGVMIVRSCYERRLSIITKRLAETRRGSGVIFTGSEGNGRVSCATAIYCVVVVTN